MNLKMATPKIWNPPAAAQPVSHYSLCAVYPAGLTVLEIAGQVGMDADGNVPEGVSEQTRLAWKNMFAVLEANHMGYQDIVSLRINLLSRESIPEYRATSSRYIAETSTHPPRPSTLILVSGLFDPRWKVEIEARAAKAL